MDILKNFGLRVKELRTEKGLSQEALALKADIDRTYITGVETGKRNVSLKLVHKIICALEVNYSDFFNSQIFNQNV